MKKSEIGKKNQIAMAIDSFPSSEREGIGELDLHLKDSCLFSLNNKRKNKDTHRKKNKREKRSLSSPQEWDLEVLEGW